MKLNEIKEVGFYREENDSDRKIIFEIYKNGDREWLEKDPNATLLLDTWIYEYKDENDRRRYFTNGDLSAVYLDETSIDVIKIEDTNYKVFGEYGHLLIEDKPTYKEQLENSEVRIKELEEKLTVEEMKNFDLREEIKELKDLNRRLDNQREEYWKGYLKLDKKLEIAKETLTSIESQSRSCCYKFCKDNIRKSLQKIKEVNINNNSNPKKTIKIFGKEIDEDIAKKVLQQILDEIADYEEECKKNGKNIKEIK